ncbi:MAG TPA: PQQ-binding-like beta-propeller repeat protein [Myxococcota bacterium]|nr:PQQ-binding-like beta-propeller repeat protein [Myxococcota bacterium]
MEEECGGDDCDDQAAAVNPGAAEWFIDASCHDGVDNDCDQGTDAEDIGCWDCLDDAECDDGVYCNGRELCGQHLGCLEGVPPCPGTECNRCQEDPRTCLDPEGTPCGDATITACDGADTCDGQGACLARLAADGQPCDDGTVCNGAERCLSGACQPGEPLACDDGLYCNGPESCDPALGCQPGLPPCAEAECNHCQEDGDSCLDPEGTACGEPAVAQCDGADTCDGLGSCDPRHLAAGTPCDDGEPCSTHDTCLEGACLAGPVDLDADGDGFVAESCGGDDCEDGAAWVNPIALEGDFPEECADGADDDCDGFLDRLDQGCFGWQHRWTVAFDREVRAMTVEGGKVYAGGAFRSVSQLTGMFGVVNLSDSSLEPTTPKIEGRIRSIAPDGNGGWYIATDDEATVDGVLWGPWLHLQTDGTPDENWRPALAEQYCLVHAGGSVFVGGGFTSIGGDWGYQYLAAFDPVTGAPQPWQPDLDGYVSDLYSFGDTLIAVGGFTHVGGVSRQGIAAFDTTTHELLPLSISHSGSIDDLTVLGDTLYLAGDFTRIQGQLRTNVAAVDASSGELLAWQPEIVDREVWAISASGSTVYVGGPFEEVNGQPKPYIAALDASTGELLPWSPPALFHVFTILATDVAVLVNGTFQQADGLMRTHLVALRPDTGELVEEFPQTNGDITEIAVQGNRVGLGGLISRFGASARTTLAAFSLATGELLEWSPIPTQPAGEPAPAVLNLAAYDGKVYSGSQSLRQGPCFRALDGATGQDLFTHPDLALGCELQGMDRKGSTLYLGAAIGGYHKYALDLATGSWLPWSPVTFGNSIVSITVADGPVFMVTPMFNAGGYYTSLVAYDLQSGDMLDWRQSTEYFNLFAKAVGTDAVAIKSFYERCESGTYAPRNCGLVRYSGTTGEELWRNYDFSHGRTLDLIAPDLLLVGANVWVPVEGTPYFFDSYRLVGVDATTGEMAEWFGSQINVADVIEVGEGYVLLSRAEYSQQTATYYLEAYELVPPYPQ